MSKRARYTGSTPVRVAWPPGDVYNTEYNEIVEPNHQLPADAPAKLRDELLTRDDWTEVESASSSSSSKSATDKEEKDNG